MFCFLFIEAALNSSVPSPLADWHEGKVFSHHIAIRAIIEGVSIALIKMAINHVIVIIELIPVTRAVSLSNI